MVVGACPKCGFPLGVERARIVEALKRKRKSGWSLTDLSRELGVAPALVFRRVKQLEVSGVVETRVVISESGKRRLVELVKRIKKPKEVV